MKPISEMTLQECLASIRRGDYLNRHHLADRIHSLTRWIPVEERLPTEGDADRYGFVEWWSEDEVALPVAHYWDYTGEPKYKFTHWRRIDTP